MKFKANSNKVVRLGDKRLAVFTSGFFETSDKGEISTLEKAKGVTAIKAKKQTKQD